MAKSHQIITMEKFFFLVYLVFEIFPLYQIGKLQL